MYSIDERKLLLFIVYHGYNLYNNNILMFYSNAVSQNVHKLKNGMFKELSFIKHVLFRCVSKYSSFKSLKRIPIVRLSPSD